MGVRCCGKLLGLIKFMYWERVSKKVLIKTAQEYPKAGAVGSAFDPVDGRVVGVVSGRTLERPTYTMQLIADELGGLGNKVLCPNPIGACVEFKGADILLKQGSVIGNIRFVPVIRPRTMSFLDPCAHCIEMLKKFNNGPVPQWQDFNLMFFPYTSFINTEFYE